MAYPSHVYALAPRATVTQTTNAGTGVICSGPCGTITTVALATAGAAEETFIVTNTYVAATDCIVFGTTYAGTGIPIIAATAVGAGVFTIQITNVSATQLNAVMVINFAIIKTV